MRNKNKVEGLKKLGALIHIFEVEDIINVSRQSHFKLYQTTSLILTFLKGDLSPAFTGAKYVIHAAAPVLFTSNDPDNEIIKPAVGLTQNVLKHALKAGIKVSENARDLICHASSRQVDAYYRAACRHHLLNGCNVR